MAASVIDLTCAVIFLGMFVLSVFLFSSDGTPGDEEQREEFSLFYDELLTLLPERGALGGPEDVAEGIRTLRHRLRHYQKYLELNKYIAEFMDRELLVTVFHDLYLRRDLEETRKRVLCTGIDQYGELNF